MSLFTSSRGQPNVEGLNYQEYCNFRTVGDYLSTLLSKTEVDILSWNKNQPQYIYDVSKKFHKAHNSFIQFNILKFF